MSTTPLILRRRQAAWVLWAERLIPSLGPAAAVLAAFLCAALLGWPALLPAWARALLLLAVLATIAALGARGWRRLAPPGPAEIDRRLEHNAGDPHRPLLTIADHPAWSGAEAVWQAHRQRALAGVPALRAGAPRLDARALAGITTGLLAILLCLRAAGPDAGARLASALLPRPVMPVPPAPRIQAWIVPPRGTGLGPIFLHPSDAAPVTVPLGGELTVAVLGGTAIPDLACNGRSRRFARLDRTGFQAKLTLGASGTVTVTRDGDRLAQWPLRVVADQPPAIALTGPAALDHARVHLPWTATDDYGLAQVTAELRLQARPQAPPLRVPLRLAGTPRHASGSDLPDLTAQPWAGLPVLVQYVAIDGSGQHAATAPALVVLPERAFTNAVARALVDVRRGLVLNPDATATAVASLDTLSGGPGGRLPAEQWLNLRAIGALLAEQPDGSDEAVARLWQLAVAIEDGGVAGAKQRLVDARNALSDALTAAASADPATRAAAEKQIAALSRQLQQALAQYLQAMQQQAARNGLAPPQGQGGRTVDAGQLQQMARQMADAAHAGRLADAQAQLQQLGSILDNLRQSTQSAQAGASGPRNPAFDALLRDQGTLRSHADSRLSDDADPRAGPGRDPDEAAGQPDPTAQRKQDLAAQGALRQRLGALAQHLGEATGQVPDGLARADGAMRDAAGALARGDDGAARSAQQRALDGLRSGSEAGGEATAAAPGPGQDPLGRTAGGQALDEDSDVALPGRGDITTGRAVRDELRRRGADRTRPPQELDYIQRLLQQ